MELSDRVTRQEDGVYRWLYELDMKKNLILLKTVIKIVGFCLCIPLLLLTYLSLRTHGSLSSLLSDLTPVLICIPVIALITLGSYMYVSRMYGGKYCVIYELDEKGISFTQIEEQFEKQQVIARAAAFTGALTGNIGLVGSALYNMYNNTAYSDFEKVYSVKSYKDKEVIKVNSPFLFNQIYVKKEDFDFVDSFIREHCPKIH
ncbi:MAG: hypothetical protein IJ136_01415 [Erysipelotrichaceae bacterium]|nr:hypothetical protein [Erysipelotrichaceae bacterium]MBR6260855.1 hypothetical protein [Erysipelotrichaceae bacterium]